MTIFRNRKEKKFVEKGLENTGEATLDVAAKRPVRAAGHAYKAGEDFDRAYKASKPPHKGSGSAKGKRSRGK